MIERLQKYMAGCGTASRRKCEEYITQGKVKVNGQIITELGYKVDSMTDTVIFEGRELKIEQNMRYIMLNKPEGIICSVKDEKGRKTVIDIINVEQRIYPIGRLDYDTSGLIILTNDGDVYNKIIHPSKKIDKKYIACINGFISNDEIVRFQNGIDIGGYITAASQIKVIKKLKQSCVVQIIIHEGKNRQIRKMCDAIGHPVLSLKRVSIGKINIGNLEIGKWRDLSKNELQYILNL